MSERVCKRCGKPCRSFQEYCGAACSERRKEPYPQPDEVEKKPEEPYDWSIDP